MPKFIQPAVPKPKKPKLTAAQLRRRVARVIQPQRARKMRVMRQIPHVTVNVHVGGEQQVKTSSQIAHVS